MTEETTTDEAVVDALPASAGYLMDVLNYPMPTTEAALENAVAVYKMATAKQESYAAVKDEAKHIISEIMAETGVTNYNTRAGKAYVTAAGVSVSYNTQALDALAASDDNLARILAPHRTVKERAGALTIK